MRLDGFGEIPLPLISRSLRVVTLHLCFVSDDPLSLNVELTD